MAAEARAVIRGKWAKFRADNDHAGLLRIRGGNSDSLRSADEEIEAIPGECNSVRVDIDQAVLVSLHGSTWCIVRSEDAAI